MVCSSKVSLRRAVQQHNLFTPGHFLNANPPIRFTQFAGIDLSDNKLGLAGAQAISAMLKENVTLVNINLCGNEFDDHAATPLAEAFMSNHKVQSIDLSHNLMGEGAGTARQLLWGLHTAVTLQVLQSNPLDLFTT